MITPRKAGGAANRRLPGFSPLRSAIPGRKLRPPVKRHGGKAYLARRIAALFPPHEVYLEPFVGGGSVLLNKGPAPYEFAGDLDAELVNFWEVLRDPGAGLAERLAA